MTRSFAPWHLLNLDDMVEVEGQFPAEDVVQELGVAYGEGNALNRQHPILQFLHGNAETVSFSGRLYARNATEEVESLLKTLKGWTKRDPMLMRPPLLMFWIGDSGVQVDNCVLEALSGIMYHDFRENGTAREVSFTIHLREYYEYSLAAGEGGETRYHRAKEHDYYEWITYREYGDPMLGVVIRDQHPTKPNLEIGDIVKLPNAEEMRDKTAKPTSIALQTAFGRKDTAQKRLVGTVIDRLSVEHTSHVI